MSVNISTTNLPTMGFATPASNVKNHWLTSVTKLFNPLPYFFRTAPSAEASSVVDFNTRFLSPLKATTPVDQESQILKQVQLVSNPFLMFSINMLIWCNSCKRLKDPNHPAFRQSTPSRRRSRRRTPTQRRMRCPRRIYC